MFILGLGLYALSSLAGGLAGSPAVLIAARAVQGLGGALLSAATLSLVHTTFAEGRERNRALSVWGAAGGSGMILGSLLGGVLTQAFGWESVFFVNVPLAVLAMALAFVLIAPDAARQTGRRFDLPGALTATAGTTLVVFALVEGPESGWGSPSILVSAGLGALLLLAFVAIERRSSDPLMPMRLFANRNLSTGVAITFLFTATFGTLLYFLTVYFQSVHGYSALGTGVAFLVPMGAIFVGAMQAGRAATRFGIGATLTASLIVGAAGTVILGLSMAADASYAVLIPGLVVLGLGQGTTYTVMFGAAATGVAAEEQGIASGIASTGLQIGGAVGLAVLVAIANAGTEGLSGEALRVATTDGLRTAVLLAAAGIAVTVLVALSLGRAAKAPAVAEEGAVA
jgi:MFS family permease